MNNSFHLTLPQKLVLTTLLSGLVFAGVLLAYLSSTRTRIVEAAGVNTGRAVSSQVVSLRVFYTKEIAARAQKAGMTLAHDFDTKEGALPLPATLVKALGSQIARDYPGTNILLKSRYPFPNRVNESKLDEFQTRALAALEQDPKSSVHQIETVGGRLSVRYAVADIMSEGCVACHNNSPLSPKKDWKVGDVRGIVEVVAPVDEISQQVGQSTMVAIFLVLGGFGLMATVIWITMQRILSKPLVELKRGIQAFTDGDLSYELRTNDSNEIGQLTSALEGMRKQLHRTILTVRTTAGSVNENSKSISLGNHDLHERTEQTANTLEEIAAAMEQLRATVDHNGLNAHQGSELAQNASEIASKGGMTVNQVVDTMNEIHTGSKKIVEIIAVIDGIAFQTNILALNAAVEAARAGEQGRGFAVVAAEVRQLAGRSAEAAKSIKHLITESVDQVAKGTTLVGHAAGTMEQVVTAIAQARTIMDEISTASKEQAISVAQVGSAVVQIDGTTQQNAALTEQMRDATKQLEQLADGLGQQIAVFTLGH